MKDLEVKIGTAKVDSKLISAWAEEFNSKCAFRRADADFDGQTLLINAHDISVFIEASEVGANDLLAIHRLKRSAISALDSTLMKRQNPLVKRNLENAKTTILESSTTSAGYDEQILKPRVLEKLPHV